MDGKVATPAALNGKVRTIPEIDKTLSIEGQCADAKATGDALAGVRDSVDGLDGSLRQLHNRVNGDIVNRLSDIESDARAMDERVCALEEYNQVLEHKFAVSTGHFNTASDKITSDKNEYARNINVCTATVDFNVIDPGASGEPGDNPEIRLMPGEVLFGGLPKPAVTVNFLATNAATREVYILALKESEGKGVITTTASVPAGGDRLVGYITYITAKGI